MPKWHHESVFGTGPRRPLDREQRARFKFLAKAHRVAGHITADHHDVAEALLRRLGADGQCDPTHETLRADAGCKCVKTVQRALARLSGLGLLSWHRRLVRIGWRVQQTSNAYLLMPRTVENPAPFLAVQKVKSSLGISAAACPPVSRDDQPPASATDMAAAQTALAARRAVMEARLVGRSAP
jgi:hypothetical protein